MQEKENPEEMQTGTGKNNRRRAKTDFNNREKNYYKCRSRRLSRNREQKQGKEKEVEK